MPYRAIMSCLNPRKLTVYPYDPKLSHLTGKAKNIAFGQWFDYVNEDTGEASQLYEVPCGVCSECRKAKRRQWSERLQLEASCYPDNCVWFVTLTYDDDHINLCPEGNNGLHSLVYAHFTDFIKRLRDFFYRSTCSVAEDFRSNDRKLRYFIGCEYGDRFARPHAHVLLFGPDLSRCGDLLLQSETPEGKIFTSSFIGCFWTYGFNTAMPASPANIGYTTGYVNKKLSKFEDYESRGLKPEKCFMSTKPALGTEFFEINKDLIIECGGYVNPYDGSFHKLPRSSLRNVFSDDPTFVAVVNHRKKISAIRQLDYEDQVRGERAENARARIAAAEAAEVRISRKKI